MKELDEELEQRPTPKKVRELAELRIQNLQSFSELQSFNDTGKWKYEHPLLAGHSERSQLEELRRKDPEDFLKQHSNCIKNIQRYQSYLKSPKREEKREADRKNLNKHIQRVKLFKSLLQSEQP
ncbi:MAG: hypothetical protein LUG98_13460 [Tannerellaceae bacterium]|nr:hypothetical protein [Tannerellaceae bacterium]